MSVASSVADQTGQPPTRTALAMPTKADNFPAVYESSISTTSTTSSLLSPSSLAHSKVVPSSVATGNIFQTTIDNPITHDLQQRQQQKHAHQVTSSTPMTEDHATEDPTAAVVVGTSTTKAPLITMPPVSSSLDATALSSIKEDRPHDLGTTFNGSQPSDTPDQQLSGELPPASDKPGDTGGCQQVPQLASARERGHDDEEKVSSDVDGEGADDEPRVHTAVFRPQLDDIMLDQDLLDFYQRLKELVSRSPLKTAQALYAFSAATSHLEIDLEKPSIFNMYHKTFSFYQDNTWFTVDLEPNLEEHHTYGSDLESSTRLQILPTRHKLFPAPKRWNDYGHDQHPSSSSSSYAAYLDSLYSFSPSQLHGTSQRSKKRRPSRERSPSRYSRYDDYERTEQDGRRRGRGRDRDRSRDDRLPSRHSHRHPSTSPSRHREGEMSSKRTRTDSTNDGGYGFNDADSSYQSQYLTADGELISFEERRRLRKKLKRRRREEAERAAAEAAAGAGDLSHSQAATHGYTGRDPAMANNDASRNFSYSGSEVARDTTNGSQVHPASQSTRTLKLVVRPPMQPPARGESGSQTPQTPVSSGGIPRTILPNEVASDAASMRPPSTTPTTPKPEIPLSPHQIRRKGKHIGSAYSLSSLVPLPEDAAARNHKPGAPPEEKLKKGTWTSQEEEMLLEAVRELSSENWHAVAARVPGRNAKQCMQKWQTDLDPQINRLPWTIEEDQRLVEAYQAYGNSWQQIAKVVETRTWYQCYNRVRAKSVKSRIMNAANFPAGGAAAGSGAGAGASTAGGGAGSGSGDTTASTANGSSRGSKLKDTLSGQNRGPSSAPPRDASAMPTGAGPQDADEVVIVKQEDGGVKPTAASAPGPSFTTSTPGSTYSQSPLSTPNAPSTKFVPMSTPSSSTPGSSSSTSSAAGAHSSAATTTAPPGQFAGNSGQGIDAGHAPPPSHQQLQQRSERNVAPVHSSGRDLYSQPPQSQTPKPNMEHGSRVSYSAHPHHHSGSNHSGHGGTASGSPSQPLSASRMSHGHTLPAAQAQQQHPYQQHQQQPPQHQQQYRGQVTPTPHSPHLQQTQQQGQRVAHAQGPTPQSQHQQQRPVSHQSPQMPQRSSHEMARSTPPTGHSGSGSQVAPPQEQLQQGAQGYHGQGQQGHGHGHNLSGTVPSTHQGYQSNQTSSQPAHTVPQHAIYQQHPNAQVSPRQQQQPQQPQQQASQTTSGHHRPNASQGLVPPQQQQQQQQQQPGYFPPTPSGQGAHAQRPAQAQAQAQPQQPSYQSQDQQQRHHGSGQNAGGVAQQQQRSQASFPLPPPISTTAGTAASSSGSTLPRSGAPPGAVSGGSYASPHRPSPLGSTLASSGISSASPTASSMAAPSPSVGVSTSPATSTPSSMDGGGGSGSKPSTTTPFSIPIPSPSPSLSGLPPQLSPGALAFVPTSQLLKMTKPMQSPAATGFPPSNLPLRSPVTTQPPRPLPSPSVQGAPSQHQNQNQQQQQQQQQQASQGQQQQQPTAQSLNPYFQGPGWDHPGRSQQ